MSHKFADDIRCKALCTQRAKRLVGTMANAEKDVVATTWKVAAQSIKMAVGKVQALALALAFCLLPFAFCLLPFAFCLFAFLPFCLFAFLPFCLFAFLPFCLFAFLPFCLFAFCLLPFAFCLGLHLNLCQCPRGSGVDIPLPSVLVFHMCTSTRSFDVFGFRSSATLHVSIQR